jgi:hypothetical protein
MGALALIKAANPEVVMAATEASVAGHAFTASVSPCLAAQPVLASPQFPEPAHPDKAVNTTADATAYTFNVLFIVHFLHGFYSYELMFSR